MKEISIEELLQQAQAAAAAAQSQNNPVVLEEDSTDSEPDEVTYAKIKPGIIT